MAERGGLAGIGEHGTFTEGPQGTWEVLSSPLNSSALESGEESLAHGCCALYPRGAKPRCSGGTALRRKQSNAGGAAGSRSDSQYRRNGGTNPRDPVKGREHRNTGTFEGKMAQTSGFLTVSTKLERKLAREMPQARLVRTRAPASPCGPRYGGPDCVFASDEFSAVTRFYMGTVDSKARVSATTRSANFEFCTSVEPSIG